MKKRLLSFFVIVVVIMTTLGMTNVFAETKDYGGGSTCVQDYYYYTNDPWYSLQTTGEKCSIEYSEEMHGIEIKYNGEEDPYATLNFAIPVNLLEYPYMVIYMNYKTASSPFEVYPFLEVAGINYPAMPEQVLQKSSTNWNTNEYAKRIFKMTIEVKDVSGTNKGTLAAQYSGEESINMKGLRFDGCNSPAAGDTIYIQYIAFFKTMGDASSFEIDHTAVTPSPTPVVTATPTPDANATATPSSSAAVTADPNATPQPTIDPEQRGDTNAGNTGLVIAIVAGVLVVGAVVYFFIIRKKR